VVSDSSQIELRTNNWLAGNKRKLDIIRAFDRKEGPDPYRLLASSIYGKAIENIQKMERFIGKVGELGLGFQMGAQKYQTTLSLGVMGPPVDIPIELARKTVNTYRRDNKEIVAQWANLKQVLLNMALKREGHYGPDELMDYEQGAIWMPNGLSMNYPGLTAIIDAEDKVRSFKYFSHGVWKHIYGGLFCENIVQCLARIIVGEQMLRIAEKYRVVMMTHDEIACVVPKKEAEKALHFMIDEMRKPPSWAPDIPLNAEGGFDVCYSK
jgi:DNA polymerase I-like protein with 3'-5' exonuclease and polymerase domains